MRKVTLGDARSGNGPERGLRHQEPGNRGHRRGSGRRGRRGDRLPAGRSRSGAAIGAALGAGRGGPGGQRSGQRAEEVRHPGAMAGFSQIAQTENPEPAGPGPQPGHGKKAGRNALRGQTHAGHGQDRTSSRPPNWPREKAKVEAEQESTKDLMAEVKQGDRADPIHPGQQEDEIATSRNRAAARLGQDPARTRKRELESQLQRAGLSCP